MRFPSIPKTLQRYRSNLKRSSAIQQGLLNLSIFLISLFLLSLTTYFFVQDALSTRMDGNLEQRMTMLMTELDDDDWEEDWEELAEEHPSLYQKLDESVQGDDFLLVLSERELKLSQNRVFRKQGFSTRELKRGRRDDDTQYRILVRERNGVVFVVGENNENDQEILELVISAFWLNALVALILTALLVFYLANRSHKQIRRIEYVLDQAAQGDLKQRIGPSHKNDDLAHVSTHIDTMLSRLETSMAAMTDISANIAHELKTPISRLRHDLNTALDNHEQGKDVEAALNDAYDESSYITETFDALLRIAQIEGGARRSNFTQLDLRAVIDTVMDIYEEVAEDSGMKLVLGSSFSTMSDTSSTTSIQSNTKRGSSDSQLVNDTPLMIQGDKELLVQMLANLIENAIRYCPEGTTITLDYARMGEQIQLSVADNGIGIPEADRERVFQRLYRVDKSRSDQRGTGLGLSLVKAIVELHGAEIRLEDNLPGLRVVISMTGNRTILMDI